MSENQDEPSQRQLPDGWRWSTFSTVATIASNLVPPQEWGSLPHIAPDNIARDTGKLLPFRTVSEDGVTSAKHLFKPGQLLYSKIRPYLNKCVRVDFGGLCSADMYPLDAHIESAYLHYYILSRQFVSAVSEASGSRTVLPKTNQEQLSEVPVPVAPMREQHRIVEAIESYVTRLDDAVATLERVERNLKRYRASVLKSAVEGRLVPTEAALAKQESRDYEPASVLLERILTERRRRWSESGKKGKNQEPTSPQATDLPDLPEGWCWATLDQLAHLIRNGQSMAPSDRGIVPILRISAVRAMTVDFQDVRYLPGAATDYSDDLLATGDLLFTRYNGSPSLVGVCGLVHGLTRETVHPDKLIKVRIHAELLAAAYVELACNTGESRAHVASRIRTTAGQAGVSGADLRQMPVPLPPLEEQRRIAAEVARFWSISTGTSGLVAANRTRVQRLRQSILKWAFEGKLADQDPNDEPASVLLERIKAEREAATPATGKKKRA